MHIANDIASSLTSSQKTLFEGTCFGPWLRVQQGSGDPMLTNLFLQHMIDVDELPVGIERGEEEFWFYFQPVHYARFGREEFCLVTGLRFGRYNSSAPYIQHIRTPSWVLHVFPDYKIGGDGLKVYEFEIVVQNKGQSSALSDDNFVRVCLILLVEAGFTGKQPNQYVSNDLLLLASDLEAWNKFPWGSYLWEKVHEQISGSRSKIGANSRKYTLLGFMWAFKVSTKGIYLSMYILFI